MHEPTGEEPAIVTSESQAPDLITVPEGLISPEMQASVDEAMAPVEPVIDEAAQKLAEAKILANQAMLAQASAEAAEAARTTNESLGIKE